MENADKMRQLHPKAVEFALLIMCLGLCECLLCGRRVGIYRKCLPTHVLVEFEDCYLCMVSLPSTCTVGYNE